MERDRPGVGIGAGDRERDALRAGTPADEDIAGPLCRPTELLDSGHAVCVGGRVGTAVVLPVAQRLYAVGMRVTSIIGGRPRERVVLEEEWRRCGEVIACTHDRSYPRAGVVTTKALRDRYLPAASTGCT